MDAKDVIIGPNQAWPDRVRVVRKGADGVRTYWPRRRLKPVGVGGEERIRHCGTDVRGCAFCPTCGTGVIR